MRFDDLGLSQETLKAIKEKGYETPTEIQAKAIPAILMMRDVVGIAQTGSGKTAGFTVPMIEILSQGRARARMPRSLILSPTRELAAQITENFELYGKYHNLSHVMIIGGSGMQDQIKELDKGVDVLIATPGRLLDLFERGAVLLNDISVFVIDEADRMLDMGFIPDIEKIAKLLPASRQSLLFSATMPKPVRALADKFLSNPKDITVAPTVKTAKNVAQHIVYLHKKDKQRALEAIMKNAGDDMKYGFVFCNRKRDVDFYTKNLKQRGYNIDSMHGDMPQAHRNKVLQAFRDGALKALICSDVAARGIDVSGSTHVVNMDIPMTPDDYVHRVGRTGRAGKSGEAWSFIAADDEEAWERVQKIIGDTKLETLYFKNGEFSDKKGAAAAPKPLNVGAEKSASDTPKPAKNDKPRKDKRPPKPRDDKRFHEKEDESPQGFGDDIPSFFG